MERKNRRIVFQIVNWTLMLLIFAGMFYISLPTGFAAIGFSILGASFGSFNKTKRLQREFYNKLFDCKEDLLKGKTIVVESENNALTIKVVDTETSVIAKEEKKSSTKKQSRKKDAEAAAS